MDRKDTKWKIFFSKSIGSFELTYDIKDISTSLRLANSQSHQNISCFDRCQTNMIYNS